MKRFKEFMRKVGVVPTPIHFKHVDVKKKKKHRKKKRKHLKESSHHTLESWYKEHDNAHRVATDHHNHYNLGKQLEHDQGEIVHKESIKHYCGDSKHGIPNSTAINQHLLDKHNHPHLDHSAGDKKHSEHIAVLDHETTTKKLEDHLHVYSGLGFDPDKHIKNKRLHSPCYTSTTHSKFVANGFGHYEKHSEEDGGKLHTHIKHIAHIHLKPGDHAVHVDHISPNEGEHESILPRGINLIKSHHVDYHENEYPEAPDKRGIRHKYITRVHHFTVEHHDPKQGDLFGK